MKKIYTYLFAILLLPIFLTPIAKAGNMSPWEFRQVWNDFLSANEMLNEKSIAPNKQNRAQRIAKLRSKVNLLTDIQLQTILDSMPSPEVYAEQVAILLKAANNMETTKLPSVQLNTLSDVPALNSLIQPSLFSPAYPTGGNYDTFTATLEGLGLLSDSSDAGTETNDERCSSDGEAAQQIALATEKVICVLAELTADAIIEPLSRGIAFGLALLCQETVVATEISIAQCDLQDALVDGAEIEATYENSKIISGQITEVSVELDAHDTNIENEIDLHHINISNTLGVHDIDIKNALNQHDTEVKNALNQHDVDIKSLLANIQAGVNANGNKIEILLDRQLELVRLLHTPQGRRVSSVPACNGGNCDWPERN